MLSQFKKYIYFSSEFCLDWTLTVALLGSAPPTELSLTSLCKPLMAGSVHKGLDWETRLTNWAGARKVYFAGEQSQKEAAKKKQMLEREGSVVLLAEGSVKLGWTYTEGLIREWGTGAQVGVGSRWRQTGLMAGGSMPGRFIWGKKL